MDKIPAASPWRRTRPPASATGSYASLVLCSISIAGDHDQPPPSLELPWPPRPVPGRLHLDPLPLASPSPPSSPAVLVAPCTLCLEQEDARMAACVDLQGRPAPPRRLGHELACPCRPSPSRASYLLVSAKAILFLRVRPRCCSAAPSRFVSSSSRPRGRQVPGRQDPSSSSTCMYDYLHATNCGVTRATSTAMTPETGFCQVPLRYVYHYFHNMSCTTTVARIRQDNVYHYRCQDREYLYHRRE